MIPLRSDQTKQVALARGLPKPQPEQGTVTRFWPARPSEGVEGSSADLAKTKRVTPAQWKGILYHWSTRFTAATFRDSG